MTLVTSDKYFVCAKVENIYVYSCYIPPSVSLEEFHDSMDRLASDAHGKRPLLIAGDFNAWALEWGSRKTTAKGKALLQALSTLDVVLMNVGSSYTFNKNGVGSIIDLTFISSTMFPYSTWSLSDIYTHSDHQPIICTLRESASHTCAEPPCSSRIGWKLQSLDKDLFRYAISQFGEPHSAQLAASALTRFLTDACDASMRRKRPCKKFAPVYWWNDTISGIRAECNLARRKCLRARLRVNFAELQADYKKLRKRLKQAIIDSKRQCFRKLCDEAETNPWGMGYKIVTKKLKGPQAQPTCPLLLGNIVHTLFPSQEPFEREDFGNEPLEFQEVSDEEVIKAAGKMQDNKSPGLDGIPNAVLKLAVKEQTPTFTRVFNKCLSQGVFPDIWKRQRLVLLPKSDKPAGGPSDYRPICMLDTLGKMLETFIATRLEEAIDNVGGLTERQLGFRKGRSTVDAVSLATQIASEAISGERWMGGTKEYCLIVTLDIKNAFNSANWSQIMTSLRKRNVPKYLRRMIESYFMNRELFYETKTGCKKYRVTGGVPQGSVLGPLLWNIMYDDILRLEVPKEATVIGFADDIAVVIVAKHTCDIVRLADDTVRTIQEWLCQMKLTLAEHKTEAVLISSRKKREQVTIRVGEHFITSKEVVKYLGMLVDSKLSFKEHLQYASQKAAKMCIGLSRLMANTKGPKQRKRLLFAGVVKSVLLYGAPVWCRAINIKSYTRDAESCYRLCALRVISAYRTVSEEAALVIAGMHPFTILAQESTHQPIDGLQRKEARELARKHSTLKWQQQWNTAKNGRWTHRLIPDIASWISRRGGEVDYFMTQILTGHGCFRAYLFRFKRDTSPYCESCANVEEDARHVFFECSRFGAQRQRLASIFGERPTPENLVSHMMTSSDNWLATCSMASEVINILRVTERHRSRRLRRDSNGD